MSAPLTATQVLGLTAVVGILVAGQVLFKLAAQQIALEHGLWMLLRSFLSWQLIAALVVYGVGTLLWVLLLTSIPLGRAYPFAALSFALLPIVSMVLLNEPLSIRYLAGLTLLLAGLYLIAGASSD
jgi:undecaprenyl phosphate-alpha-L-ara4N flippase subunit ArnE